MIETTVDPEFRLNRYERYAFPVLEKVDPEFIHGLTIATLRAAEASPLRHKLNDFFDYSDRCLEGFIGGKKFRNPLMLSGGFDKRFLAIEALRRLCFGGVEGGSVTEKQRHGNVGKRAWRFVDELSLANFFGLNNPGWVEVHKTVSRLPHDDGVNFGINFGLISEDGDCVEKLANQGGMFVEAFAALADYLVANVCPNVKNGLNLKDPDTCYRVIDRMKKHLDIFEQRTGTRPALFQKVLGDLDRGRLKEIACVAMNTGVDGLILSNTYYDWPLEMRRKYPDAKGGLSGRTVFPQTVRNTEIVYDAVGERVDIIPSGGIFYADDGIELMKVGAKGFQMLTGLIYRGPTAPKEFNQGLVKVMEANGIYSLARLRQCLLNVHLNLDLRLAYEAKKPVYA